VDFVSAQHGSRDAQTENRGSQWGRSTAACAVATKAPRQRGSDYRTCPAMPRSARQRNGNTTDARDEPSTPSTPSTVVAAVLLSSPGARGHIRVLSLAMCSMHMDALRHGTCSLHGEGEKLAAFMLREAADSVSSHPSTWPNTTMQVHADLLCSW